MASARDPSHAERQLILISAGVAERRDELGAASAKLFSAVDWDRLPQTLRGRRLLPLLGPRIAELAGALAPEGFIAAVQDAVDRGRRQGAFLQMLAERAKVALADAGIRSSALKGPFLGEAIHGDLGRRPSADIDLLVPPERLAAAVAVVCGLGFARPRDNVDKAGFPALHFTLAHARGELPPIELHWRVHWYERSFAADRLLPPTYDVGDVWQPAPGAELAALLLFYARDGFVDLRLAADVSAWWDRFGSRLRIGELDELVASYPGLGRVLPAAAKVAEKIVGLPLDHVFADLPAQSLRDRIVMRLANPNPDPRASLPQLNADMGLIDGLLMPRGGGAAFVRRQLLPPRRVLRGRAKNVDARAVSPLGHCARVLGRYGLAIAQAVRSPETFPLG